jgi:hypothetical protein
MNTRVRQAGTDGHPIGAAVRAFEDITAVIIIGTRKMVEGELGATASAYNEPRVIPSRYAPCRRSIRRRKSGPHQTVELTPMSSGN